METMSTGPGDEITKSTTGDASYEGNSPGPFSKAQSDVVVPEARTLFAEQQYVKEVQNQIRSCRPRLTCIGQGSLAGCQVVHNDISQDALCDLYLRLCTHRLTSGMLADAAASDTGPRGEAE